MSADKKPKNNNSGEEKRIQTWEESANVPVDHDEVAGKSIISESKKLSLAIQNLGCPVCGHMFESNCEGLENEVACPQCASTFPYVDGYLCAYRSIIEVFVDDIHPVPMVPGYSTGGEVIIPPDELILVEFGVRYNKPPEVFFILPGNKSAKEWITGNQIVFPLSVDKENFIIFSRSLDDTGHTVPITMRWMAIGEKGKWEKPLWLNYMQNAADLVRKKEDVAAIVMLLIALDFYYDAILAKCGIGYDVIRREGRRPGMNEKKAKLKLIYDRMGEWPGGFADNLKDLTDFRNKIVHGVVKRQEVPDFNGRRAFQIVLRAMLFLIEMYHRKGKFYKEENSTK